MTSRTEAKVLVTTAGTIVGEGIIKSLKLVNSQADHEPKYRIVAADMSEQAASLYRSDIGILVPPISSPEYVNSIVGVCKGEAIDAIFLGADEDLHLMATNRERIEKETGAAVVVNPLRVIETAMDKWRTYEFLKKNGLPCPASSLPDDPEAFIREFGSPIMVKPREGHGSLQAYVTNSLDDSKRAIATIEASGWHAMLQEYLPNTDLEFTTGVTVDVKGKYVMSSIAMRRTLKGGQTYKAFIAEFADIRRTAEEAAMKLGARGPVNIQGRIARNELNIFEINPRFSASCPLRAVAGVNEPDIVFRNTVLGEEVRVTSFRKLVCMRYWNEVYVPFSTYKKTMEKRRIVDSDSFIPAYF